MSATVRILGIDPGSRVTGFGIIDVRGAIIFTSPPAASKRLPMSLWQTGLP